MEKLKRLIFISAIIFMVISAIAVATDVISFIQALRDPESLYESLKETTFGVLTDEAIRSLTGFMTVYYLIAALLNLVGVFLDIFYIQAVRRNLPVKRGPFIALGVIGIVCEQILPGIFFIILGAKYGGGDQKPEERNGFDVIDNP